MNARSKARAGSAALAAAGALLLVSVSAAAPQRVTIPLTCSQGPSHQEHHVTVAAPGRVARGSRYKVRIDGVDSGAISHFGLRYIHDMRADWPIPAGAAYVEGSAHLVPGTGSDNVRPGARVFRSADGVHLLLPAHVDNGGSYTPPSFEFELDANAPEGASITQRFGGYFVTANALLMGEVHTSCAPTPRDFAVAVTLVAADN